MMVADKAIGVKEEVEPHVKKNRGLLGYHPVDEGDNVCEHERECVHEQQMPSVNEQLDRSLKPWPSPLGFSPLQNKKKFNFIYFSKQMLDVKEFFI